MSIKLFKHQVDVLNETSEFNKVAYYLDMGLGKTFVGSEKMMQLNTKVNVVVCQKSKIDDWIEHFVDHYELSEDLMIYDCTKWKKKDWDLLKNDINFDTDWHKKSKYVLIINYELAWRRKELLKLKDFTLLLDESSFISNKHTKRSEFIHRMDCRNVILLSGTPTGGKYEKIWSQLTLLGWNISKKTFYQQYVIQEWIDDGSGFNKPIIVGYKNIDRLKSKLKQHGCIFMKTEEVTELPETIDITISVRPTNEYKRFMKKDYVVLPNDIELIGDTRLTKRLYSRQLCGQYNQKKLEAFKDLVESTDDRLIVFYNFDKELELMKDIVKDLEKPISIVNGKEKDLYAYENHSDSISFIQYQAGAMGLNLQKANKIVYFTLPVWAELFEQSKKRIHRIGQEQTCFYYYLLCSNSIELDILKTLKMRKDYDDALFDKDV